MGPTNEKSCLWTKQLQDSKPSAKVKYSENEPIKYAEFNSSCITRLGQSRRFRLYQVAAVKAMKIMFPSLSTADWQAYARSRPGQQLEASHFCRRLTQVPKTHPDGSITFSTQASECKECFNWKHLGLEFTDDNGKRGRCTGGQRAPDGTWVPCTHNPPCIPLQY